jgi:hypothetical protein
MTQAEEDEMNRRYAAMTRHELVNEVTRLSKLVRSRNEEIALLRKRLALYKSIK